ncbi:unnamed protein product [Camellia sinensis]
MREEEHKPGAMASVRRSSGELAGRWDPCRLLPTRPQRTEDDNRKWVCTLQDLFVYFAAWNSTIWSNFLEELLSLMVLNAGKNKLKSMDEVKSLLSLRALILNGMVCSNYCYRCGNVASILSFNENMEREVKFFTETEENNQMRGPRRYEVLMNFIPMASNKGFDGRRDLIEAYVALQHMVSSMNYTCGVYIVVLHAALERFEATRKISRNPNPFKQQLDHLNRLVRDNDIDCHEQLRMNRHTFLRLCGLIRTKGVSDSKYVVLEEKVAMYDDRWRWFQNCLVPTGSYYLVDAEEFFNMKHSSARNDGMDDTTATSGCRKKGKGKGTASSSRGRRVWTPKECDVLIRAMRDLFSEKWKADNGQFRCGFYSELEKLIILAFPGTDLRASPHIESKIKFWRRQYNLLTDMLRLSGFGWDDSEKMILVDSDEVWQNYVKREPDAKGMRNVPFIYYEDWVILFGKDRATGVLAEGPANMVDALEKEDQTTEECYTPIVDLPDCSLSASGTPYNQGGSGTTSKKRAREAEGIAKGLVDMAVEFGSFFKKTNTTMEEIAHRIGYAQDLSQARKLVNGELAKLRLNTNDRLRAATLIVKDAERVDLFFSLPEEEKMEWVCLLMAGCV